MWIGGKRIGRGNGPGANHWEWSDGKRWDFHNWFLGEPNNAGGRENCVQMYADGGWNDISADWRGPAIYKFQGEPRPPPARSSLRPDVQESGAVAIAAPIETELPIVTAIIVDAMPPDGSVAIGSLVGGGDEGDGSDAGGAPRARHLVDMAHALTEQLGLEAHLPVIEVVNRACELLGVPLHEGNLVERATKCYDIIHVGDRVYSRRSQV